MYAGRFEFGLFNGHSDPRDAALSLRVIAHGCEFLFKCNLEYCEAYGRVPAMTRTQFAPGDPVPPLYSYRRDGSPLVTYRTPKNPCGGDVWQDIPTLVGRGFGDCKDLSCYLAAYRTVFDRVPCRPVVRRRWLERGFGLYHVVVEYEDGTVEDPSVLLGMPVAMGA